MVLVENDTFLSRLTLMFHKSVSDGHVDICMKRYDGKTKPEPRKVKSKKSKKSKVKETPKAPEPEEYMTLIRARLRNEKISTLVDAENLNKFQIAYCNLLKSNMDGLKKQKKIKLKKATQQ